jgi:hypothetical protein
MSLRKGARRHHGRARTRGSKRAIPEPNGYHERTDQPESRVRKGQGELRGVELRGADENREGQEKGKEE